MNSLEKNDSNVNRNKNVFPKEKSISKSIKNELKILSQKRFTSTNNFNIRAKYKKNPFLFKRNIFIDKTNVITRINSSENKTNFITSYNSKSKLFYRQNIVQSHININISRNITLNNSISNNNSSYFNTYRNNIKGKTNINFNKIKNQNMIKNKINNTSSYNYYFINTSNNGIIKNNSNVSLNANKFEISFRNKFIITKKNGLKNKILRDKIQKAILGINTIIPPLIKLNKKKSNFEKSYKNINLDLCNNNFTKPNISNNNQNKTFNNEPNLKFKYSEKCIKNIESKRKLEMCNKRGKKESISKKAIKEESLYSGLSLYTTKVEEEGMLEINEVKDLIIYYKLDKESEKNYLFAKNDYSNFIQNRMKKYLGFYLS